MQRRRFIAALGVGASTAGCLGWRSPRADDDRTAPIAERGLPTTICEEETSDDPGIYAITDPAFDRDWRGLSVADRYRGTTADTDADDEGVLAAEATVVGVARDGVARAYPLTVLRHHEVVNDVVGGRPLVVTYCPLCRSGMVARRRVNGEATTFAVTGLLWKAPRVYAAAAEKNDRVFGASATGGEADLRHNGNLVLYDFATRSYWSQILAQAICGPMAGTDLVIAPSTVATWDQWRDDHPDGEVLLPPPYSTTTRGRTAGGR